MFGDLRAKNHGQIDQIDKLPDVHIPNLTCQSLGVAPSGMFMWIYASMLHFFQGGGGAARDLVMFLYFLFLSGRILDENMFNFTSTTWRHVPVTPCFLQKRGHTSPNGN